MAKVDDRCALPEWGEEPKNRDFEDLRIRLDCI